jgi:hypothetical protein
MTVHVPNLLRRNRACHAALLAVLALAALPAAAQFTIAGTLVNAQTGEPVAHANMAVLSLEDSHALISVTADDAGHFSLPGLPAAKYQLTASRRGFHTAFYDEHGEFSSAVVTGPDVTGQVQDTTHLVFRLAPNAVLYGAVRDDAGEPVAQASVLLFRKPASPAERIIQAGAATTDDTGAYEFGNLAAGAYLLAVKAEPWYALHPAPNHAGNPQLDVAYPITYYDSTTDENSAAPVDLVAGARVEANVTLQAVPALRLQIAVPRNQQGSLARPELRRSVFGTEIAAQSAGFLDAATTGSTEINGVAPGHYELQQGDPPRLAELDATTSGTLDPGAGTPLVDVQGQLHAAAGSALPPEISVVLTRTDASDDRQPVLQSAHNGAFHFQAPAASAWQLAVASTSQPQANLTVLSVRAAGPSQPGDRFAVGSQPLALSAEVSAAATSITGFARKDHKPFSGAMIVLIPRARNPQAFAADAQAVFASLVRRDQSDSDGSFSLMSVVPGSYTVVAIEDGWDLDWSNPAVMARYAAGGAAVTVPPDAGKSVSLSGPVAVESR